MATLSPESPNRAVIVPGGTLSDREGKELFDEIRRRLANGEKDIRADLSSLRRIDSRGCAWLIRAWRLVREDGGELLLQGAQGKVANFLDLIKDNFPSPPPYRRPAKNFFQELGEKAFEFFRELRAAGQLIVESVYWSFIAPLEGRGLRWKSLAGELNEMGFRAVGIVALINFLLGVVVAMLSAAQLRLFGVQVLVASLVVIGFARELAVLMTGIVVSARSGAAIAAELATMTVSEEVDALKAMGQNVTRFLVAPKLLAIIVAVPLLTTIGFVAGVAGGFVLGIFSLGFTFDKWWGQTLQAVTAGDLVQGFTKSFVFAFIIVIVGCHNGLRVEGGARGVGLATTRAVVMDIFFIIVADLVFASLFYFLT